ncbi:hypothetical protein HJC23_001213 [Cyclotella cryptica]|uniref:Uncharacterized protein n=1 Tax=Cyclotella cryptica TaxID=29204 RepID=A0ABD3QNX7_9STRA
MISPSSEPFLHGISSGTQKWNSLLDKAPVNEVAKSAVSNDLLRSEDVPLSDGSGSLDLRSKLRVHRLAEHPPPRTEQLTEDVMTIHLHSRLRLVWIMDLDSG